MCREKPSKYPAVAQALALWIDQVVDGNCSLSGHTVIQKAATFAQRLGIQNFRGSNGWFDRFKKRYGVRNYLRHGEANSAPLEDLQQHRTDLQKLLATWNLEDVYNCDETALFWKLEPSRTLARQPISDVKKPRDRVTVLLTCNATGTSKLTPVFIHKYKNPRCMRNIDKKSLPVYYYWNSSAWMQCSIFSHWLLKLNRDMQKAQRHILLLLDNIRWMMVFYCQILRSRRTRQAHLQPCDAGVIHSYKVINNFYYTY